MNVPKLVSAIIALSIPSYSYAVDGVGLFEFAPAIRSLILMISLVAIVPAVLFGLKRNENGKVSIVRAAISVSVVAFAAVLSYPAVYFLRGQVYKESLCNSEASVDLQVSEYDWQPPKRSTITNKVSPSDLPDGQSYLAEGLIELKSSREREFGVQEETYKIIDTSANKTLITAKYFSFNRQGCRDYMPYTMRKNGYIQKVAELSNQEQPNPSFKADAAPVAQKSQAGSALP
jgi:hypothetical protein